jgi:hypothetical protein
VVKAVLRATRSSIGEQLNKEFHHTRKPTNIPVLSFLSGFSQSPPPVSSFQEIGVLLPVDVFDLVVKFMSKCSL